MLIAKSSQKTGTEMGSLPRWISMAIFFPVGNIPNEILFLNGLHQIFTSWEQDKAKFEAQFERVVKALQTNNSGREPDSPPKLK